MITNRIVTRRPHARLLAVTIRCLLLATASLLSVNNARATRVDSTDANIQAPHDTLLMNTDAVYARPFAMRPTSALGLGGYVEANLQASAEADIGNGMSFQARRFTLFASSTPAHNIRFLAELEFENGTEEINLEFASVDLLLSSAFIVRGGILMVPIGGFNQNHDGPRWNFVDRPLSATTLLPATWSVVGMGVLGKGRLDLATLSYEVYISNGLNERIVSNTQRRTSLPAFKDDEGRFSTSFNGIPMLSGRFAAAAPSLGELGLSFASGVYSKTVDGGLDVGNTLMHHIVAADYAFGSFHTPWHVRAEAAVVILDLPESVESSYGNLQAGGYIDVNHCLWRGQGEASSASALFACVRAEYVDYHLARTEEKTGSGDEAYGGTLALAYHPSPGTIVRLNYRNVWTEDVLNNPAVYSRHLQLGVSTYF